MATQDAIAASPSASPPRVVISDALSLDSRVQPLAAPGDRSSSHPAGGGDVPAGVSGIPVDRRKMRMMKNLESATRSRARKQAHVAQIQKEVVELRKTHKLLRFQYDQLKATAAAEADAPVKATLRRGLSAPVKATLRRVLSALF